MTARLRPVVVIGAGIAGLTAALATGPVPVQLLCREADGGGSASALAQGGIAAAMDREDSAQAHARDTRIAGADHNHASMVEWLCRQAPGTVDWLNAQGVAFDRACDGQLALGREGGHGAARIVHAGGDATGAALIRVLLKRARAAAHVEWRGGLEAEALLLRGGQVCGVRARDASGADHEIEAAAVVLATGGLCAMFARTSNPAGADGAGLALALAAGAQPRDLEFVQFHPTALDISGHSLPLLTEALRGAGASLRDRGGSALMAGLHPLGDLAPRDIVARRVWQARRDGAVWLDARGVQGDFSRRFPTVLAACLAHGFDPRQALLPITPAAHFHMGGIAADAEGATSLPGLYAVGEVACTGAHGANRLASNSLLEGVACGRRLGEQLSTRALPRGHGPSHWRERGASLPPEQLKRLRALMWSAAGPLRSGAELRRALGECAAQQSSGWQARLAIAVLDAALKRRESLGAHFRTDTAPTMRYRMENAS